MHTFDGDNILGTDTRPGSAVAAVDPTYFNAYHAYADHLTFLTNLQAQFPTRSEIVTSGNSGAGRPITGIHFYGTAKGKPAIVLHGNVHAREWITGMVCPET
jgi:carboxypeptidase A4